MRYRVLGVVGQQFDDHKNLLLSQVAAKEYIERLYSGFEIINIDESIIRTSDQRRRGWVQARNRLFISRA